MMFKSKSFMLVLICLIAAAAATFIYAGLNKELLSNVFSGNTSESKKGGRSPELDKPVTVPKIYISQDKDMDGITDLDDIVEGARKDAEKKPVYKSEYYEGGYPPNDEGVCTDVIWRAYSNAGYNLKEMIDEDIRKNKSQYPGVNGAPDPNIDFRRVKNLVVFFQRNGILLTNELKANEMENLKQWQPGDIVTFSNPEHIAVISDKRRADGIPYIIHNAGPYTREADELLLWMPNITGHFRFVK